MSKNYFTQDTEDAIVAYNLSLDFVERSRIYDTKIHYAFFKLTHIILRLKISKIYNMRLWYFY